MSPVIFDHVSFVYPETETLIFNDLSLELHSGVTTLVGQNGAGKTTLLLLAAGVLLPTQGTVYLQGIDTAHLRDEQARQPYVSLIFQNMEFETEASIRTLLHQVHEQGFRKQHEDRLINKLVQVFELETCLDRKTQEVSKGELQRTILAFSVLYGSQALLMDEPIFALEAYQKRRALHFLMDFVHQEHLSLCYSVHELELSQTYSDHTLLFRSATLPLYGQTSDILTRDNLEQAYDVPIAFLKQRELLYREALKGPFQTGSWN